MMGIEHHVKTIIDCSFSFWANGSYAFAIQKIASDFAKSWFQFSSVISIPSGRNHAISSTSYAFYRLPLKPAPSAKIRMIFTEMNQLLCEGKKFFICIFPIDP